MKEALIVGRGGIVGSVRLIMQTGMDNAVKTRGRPTRMYLSRKAKTRMVRSIMTRAIMRLGVALFSEIGAICEAPKSSASHPE